MKDIILLSITLSLLSSFINNKEVLAFESINISVTSRVIGGGNADIWDFPYQASLRHNGVYICSAFSISVEDILSAAHCFTHQTTVNWPFTDITVHTGTSRSSEIGNMHEIMAVTVHPGWTGVTVINHDIAHVKLKGTILFGLYERKVNLPTRNVVSNVWGWVTGWGYTAFQTNGPSEYLQKLKIWTLNYTDCNQFMPDDLQLSEGHLCGYQQLGHGCADGDSGSPLVVQYVAIGIYSWNVDNLCALGEPDVFSDIFAERDFFGSLIKVN